MNHNELSFVAKHVYQALWTHNWLRSSRRGGPQAIADAIEKARLKYKTSDEQTRKDLLSEGTALLKKTIRSLIPPTFGWWLEIDHDVCIAVRWLWLGHPAVVHSGSVSDSDVTIMLDLLRLVDWAAEATAAMANIEESEAKLLRIAQDRRRLKLADNAHLLPALPPIEMPQPVPATIDEKRREKGPLAIPERRMTREEAIAKITAAMEAAKAERAERIGFIGDEDASNEEDFEAPDFEVGDEDDRTDDKAARGDKATSALSVPSELFPLSYEERHNSPVGTTRLVHEDGLPDLQYGLSRQIVRPALCRIQFEPYPSIRACIDAIKANPPGTYTEAYLSGGIVRLKTPEHVWGMVSNKPMPGQRGRKPRPSMTAREFRRIDTGEPRRRDNRFFRAG